METIDELTAFLTTATVDGILGRLLYRGAAWSLMREEGVLPPNAPPLGATIETDLAEHGFALLRGAMALRAQAGASDVTSKAFERAANAFEALVRNGDPESPDRGFRRTIAAAAYHLAGFSAVAYSLFNETAADLNASPGETAIRHLILRDLGQLRSFVREWMDDGAHGDEQIAEALRGEEPDVDEVLSTIVNTTICRALAHFEFALETGEPAPIDSARALLATAVNLADNAENVPLWWMSNLCRHLIDDLWQHSLHQTLPTEPPAGTEEKDPDLRRLFISSLYTRKTSEVELWPSQREAAQRSTDVTDDLVVALPTSAGKTRVAEIAALMTLSSERDGGGRRRSGGRNRRPAIHDVDADPRGPSVAAWPTPDTAALWARFRTEALSGGIQKWSVEHYKRLLDIAAAPPAGLYRIVTDEGDGRTWLATPDYQRVAAFKKSAVDPKPSLFSGRLAGNTRLVEALRVGRGKLRWPQADA